MLSTFKNGQTSVILRVKLLNSSVSTGAGLTGLTFSSSGLIISTIADVEATATAYTQAGSTIETVTTLGTYAAPTATKCRFKEVDATNNPGVYEIQIADARFAVANAKSLLVSISGVTNLAQADFVVQLQSDDPYVAKPANFNLTSIDGSGRIDMSKIAGSTTAVTNLSNGLLGTAGPVPWADITDQGTAQAVASGSITLRAGFTTDNNNIVGSVIWITGGTTGLWQNRTILTYTDSTKVATVDTWTTTPTGTTTYTLLAAAPGPATPISVSVVSGGITRASYSADSGDQTIRSNTLTAGAAGTATLDAGASAVTDFYVNCLLYLTGGTGVGQARFITAYNGSTKVATTSVNWKTTPDNTSTFAIIPFDAIVGATAPTAAQNATAVWQDPLSGSDFTTVGSIGKLLHDDIDAAVSTRATPAQVTSAVPTVMQTADALLNRDWSAVSDTNTHTVLQALRFLRNVWAISGTNLTVKKEDGTTTAWTGTVTPAPGAAPISGNTPS